MRGQVARLGSQLSAAHVEVVRALDREHKVREEAKRQAQAVEEAKESELEVVKAQLQNVQERARDANTECKRLRGQVARLGSQLCTAHIDVVRASEREDKLRREANEAAAHAAARQVEAVATLTQELQSLRSRVREQQRHCKFADGKVERLGSQLGCALIEAGRAAERAKEAATMVEKLEQRLQNQETDADEKLERLRFLKAQMAKRARGADRRAGEADALKKALLSTREKLRDARKELNCTRVQLNLNATNKYEESDSDDAEQGVSDALSDDESVDSEENEAALAVKRLRSMPTWRAIRGKGQGKGEAKMEWGTRLTIYSLLAMIVPPAAIGQAIVAIVKRTAPWLHPMAPTYETVKRCRFELRFVEEVRIAVLHVCIASLASFAHARACHNSDAGHCCTEGRCSVPHTHVGV